MTKENEEMSWVRWFLGVGFLMTQIYLLCEEPIAWLAGAILLDWFGRSTKSEKDIKNEQSR